MDKLIVLHELNWQTRCIFKVHDLIQAPITGILVVNDTLAEVPAAALT